MYPIRISHPPRGCTANWKTKVCVLVFAGGSLALTVTSAVSAREGADQNKAVAEADQQQPAAEAENADAAETGASERERTQSTDAEELAEIERNAQSATSKPESPEAKQTCRRIEVTGTHFTKRECRTAEQWAQLDAGQSVQGRRFVRDVQSQSTVIPAPGPGQDTAQGRPSGLPNPGSL